MPSKVLRIGQRLNELEAQAHEIAGESFNLSSPKQLQALLFDKLGLPVIKKTPKGQPSTAEEVLQELALDFPLPRILLEHRSLSKLKSTYTDKLPQMINRTTRRIHTSYHQAGTATGGCRLLILIYKIFRSVRKKASSASGFYCA